MRIRMIAAAIAISGFGLSGANAMPNVPLDHAVTKPVLVDYACGRGFHVTPWGDCRPNWRRPPPPRYVWRDRRDYGWGHRPPPWAEHRGYYRDDRWGGGRPRHW